MKKIFVTIIILVLTSSFVVANERISVKYIKTSDGDTARFEINGENIRVRFLGINTPEVAGEDKVEEPYGDEAMNYTKNKLDNAKKIEIEYDENADREDRFGRILAYIWVDGELFQEELVKLGYAKTYMMKANYKYADELKSAEREAKANKLGVWSDEVTEQNADIKENNNSFNTNTQANDQNNEITNYQENNYHVGYLIIVFIVVVLFYWFFGKNHKEE